MENTKETASLAGFIDDYIAHNNDSNKLKFHSNELVSLLKNLKDDINSNYSGLSEAKELESPLEQAIKPISSVKPEEVDGYISSETAFEEFINTFGKLNKQRKKSETNQLIKKIIYHYLNIAKSSSDNRIGDAAKIIANKFITSI